MRKKALTETDGDFEAAVDWLRTKGLAKAAKKSGRVAAEGLVAIAVDGGSAVAVEVNSETDFVAKNAEFQQMVGSFATAALGVADVEALAGTSIDGKSVNDILTDKIATIGENMTLRRMVKLNGESVASYVHNAATAGMGQIGVIVAMKGSNEEFGRQVAMHIAAANPAALDEGSLDPELVEREKAVLTEQARESGKPEAVIEKMIVGRMKKFTGEISLTGQAFIMEPKKTVGEMLKEKSVSVAVLGLDILASAHIHMAVGERCCFGVVAESWRVLALSLPMGPES